MRKVSLRMTQNFFYFEVLDLNDHPYYPDHPEINSYVVLYVLCDTKHFWSGPILFELSFNIHFESIEDSLVIMKHANLIFFITLTKYFLNVQIYNYNFFI